MCSMGQEKMSGETSRISFSCSVSCCELHIVFFKPAPPRCIHMSRDPHSHHGGSQYRLRHFSYVAVKVPAQYGSVMKKGCVHPRTCEVELCAAIFHVPHEAL